MENQIICEELESTGYYEQWDDGIVYTFRDSVGTLITVEKKTGWTHVGWDNGKMPVGMSAEEVIALADFLKGKFER